MTKRNWLTSDNFLIAVAIVVCLLVVVLFDNIGMPPKWHAAVLGTGISFVGVSIVNKKKWPYWPFWASLGICFAAHLAFVWVVFARLLSSVNQVGYLIWAPFAFAEGILILGLVPMLEHTFFHREVTRRK